MRGMAGNRQTPYDSLYSTSYWLRREATPFQIEIKQMKRVTPILHGISPRVWAPTPPSSTCRNNAKYSIHPRQLIDVPLRTARIGYDSCTLYLGHWPFSTANQARARDIQGNVGLASRGNSRFRREAKGCIDGPATADLHVKDGKQQILWAISGNILFARLVWYQQSIGLIVNRTATTANLLFSKESINF